TALDGVFGEGLDENSVALLGARFDERHARIHGHAAKERPVEIVSYRVRVRVAVPKYRPREAATTRGSLAAARKGTRQVFFTSAAATETTLYERDRLPADSRFTGPARGRQVDAT